MNEEIRLLNCCLQRIKSIQATLTDITPATVANDIARAKCTQYTNDCQQRIDDIKETLDELAGDWRYDPTTDPELVEPDKYDGVPADTMNGGQL